MAFGSDSIGLLFKISADSKQAQSEIEGLRKSYDKEVKAIKSSATDAKLALGRAFGFSGADTAQFENTIRRSASQLAVVGGAAVAASVGIYALVKSSADLGSKLFDLSQKTSVSVETLSSLRVAADKSGTSIEEVSNGLVRLVNNLGEAAKGDEKMAAMLNANGITAFKNSEAALAQFVTRLSQLATEEEKVQAASEVFGKRTGASLVAMFNEVGGDLDAFKDKIKELGLQMSDDTAQQADKLGDRMTELGLRFEGLGHSIANSLIPSFNDLMGVFERTGESGKKSFDLIDVTIGNVIRGVAAVSEVLNDLAENTTNPSWDNLMRLLLGRRIWDDPDPSGVSPVAVPSQVVPLKRPKGLTAEDSEEARAADTARRKAEAEAKKADAERERRLKDASDARIEIIRTEREKAQRIYESNLALEGATVEQRIKYEEAYLARLKQLIAEERQELQNQHESKAKQAAAAAALDENVNQLTAESEKRKKEVRDGAARLSLAAITEFHRQFNEIQEVAEQRRIDHLRYAAERGLSIQVGVDRRIVATHANTEEVIIGLERTAFERHKAQLQEALKAAEGDAEAKAKIKHEIALLEEEEVTKKEEWERRKQEAIEKTNELEWKMLEEEQDRILERQRLREEVEELNRRNQQRADEEAAARASNTPFGGFAGALGLDINLAETAANKAKIVSDAWTKAGGLVGGAVKSMAQGFGNLIQQWVLLGDLGPNAVRKMVAGVLAGLAAEAAVEALMELARGFAALANPFTAWRAPMHFKAAAVFGLVAGTAAIAGRAIAGNSFAGDARNDAGLPTNSRLAEADRPQQGRTVTEDRGRFGAASLGTLHIVLEPKSNDAYTLAVVESGMRSPGRLRDATVEVAGR